MMRPYIGKNSSLGTMRIGRYRPPILLLTYAIFAHFYFSLWSHPAPSQPPSYAENVPKPFFIITSRPMKGRIPNVSTYRYKKRFGPEFLAYQIGPI